MPFSLTASEVIRTSRLSRSLRTPGTDQFSPFRCPLLAVPSCKFRKYEIAATVLLLKIGAATRRSSPSRLFGLILLIAITADPAPSRALTPAKPLPEYGRQSWQTESGLPQNTVHAVLQTRDGFLWIATEGGLVRFDGQDLITFDTTNTPLLRSNLINDLVEDESGTLWSATADGLLALAPDPLHPRFTRYTTADGLPSNSVHTLRKYPGGLLLLTSAGAAVLHAGHIKPIPSLATDIPPSLVTTAPNGSLWIASGRQIVALAPGATAITPVFSAAQIPADLGTLQTIAATPKDDPKREQKGDPKRERKGDPKGDQKADPQGDLWLGGHTGLALLTRNRPPLILHPAPSADITALLPQANGTLFLGTADGLARYANGQLRPIPIATKNSRVLQLFQDRAGALWIASDLGLSRLAPPLASQPAPQPPQTPLPIPGILSVLEDREGNMWFGTDTSGLTVLRERAFSTLTTADGLAGDLVRAVFQDHTGTRWIGTNRGLDRLANGKLSSIPGLAGTPILALAETNSSPQPGSAPDLWIGTPDGLFRLQADRLHAGRLQTGRLTHLTTADGLPDDFIRSLYTDRDGSLWIGTRNGLAHLDPARLDPARLDPAHLDPDPARNPASAFTTYSRRDGLGSDVIGTLLRTRDGTLWVGTLGGLSRLEGTRFRNFTHDPKSAPKSPFSLSGDAITTLHEDRQGSLWIAAHAAGLTRLRSGVFLPIHAPQANLPDEIFSILEESGEESEASNPVSPNLWLGSSRGIYRVSLEALNALADKQSPTLATTAFGTADGMKIAECSSGGHPAGWRMQDGSLWFATLKGVASIQPGSGFDNPIPPLAAIEQVLIDDSSSNSAGNSGKNDSATLTIPPGSEHLTLHYAGLSFTAPQKVRFRYKLEGFDRDWIDAGTRRTAFYTHLPPGRYRFLVYAANNDGVWSLAPATLPFTLQPHFYQTRWFLFLTGLALAALGYLLYRSRVRFLATQYQAVFAERTRIAREIHDTLAQGYVGISVQLEIASRLLQTSPQAAASQLETTKALVRSSLAEARSSIWELRSPPATEAAEEPDSLPLRLANTIQTRRASNSPTVRLDVRGTTRALDRPLEDEFLRVAQEAVTNALLHSSAQQITITLTYAADSLQLQIADDGIGFHTPPGGFSATGHFGLKGMEERAAAIGAQFRLRSERGQGTILTLTCPLPPERQPGQSARQQGQPWRRPGLAGRPQDQAMRQPGQTERRADQTGRRAEQTGRRSGDNERRAGDNERRADDNGTFTPSPRPKPPTKQEEAL